MKTDWLFFLYTTFWVFASQDIASYIQRSIKQNLFIFFSCILLLGGVVMFMLFGDPWTVEQASWIRYSSFPMLVLGGNGCLNTFRILWKDSKD